MHQIFAVRKIIILFSIKIKQYLLLDLKDCESYTATGDTYSLYYKIDTIPGNKNDTDEYLYDLKFYAIASKNVLFLLSPSIHISNQTQFYEFGMYTYFDLIEISLLMILLNY